MQAGSCDERAYAQIRVGDPREASTLVGPLIDGAAFTTATLIGVT